MKKLLLTGAAGFIGYHLCNALSGQDFEITALDSVNDYYDQGLKYRRLENLGFKEKAVSSTGFTGSFHYPGLSFIKVDTADRASLDRVFDEKGFDIVCHLAAQAGVQYSLVNPQSYVDSNITGFLNILENCRKHSIDKLVYASSSSVYGGNEKQPFSESDRTDSPVSMYAATKKSNELMAHVYHSVCGLRSVGLRFFTVYGPWGRPDMAYFKFVKKILAGEEIDVYNNGRMKRDFTYIDDIIEGISRILKAFSDNKKEVRSDIYNIGRGRPEELGRFIEVIEEVLGVTARKRYLLFQAGDVEETFADVSSLEREFGYRPEINLEEGIRYFVDWYKGFSS